MAGQLKPSTQRGAATRAATVKTSLTSSHRKKPNTAEPAFADARRPVMPSANKAAGTTTASAEQSRLRRRHPEPATHQRCGQQASQRLRPNDPPHGQEGLTFAQLSHLFGAEWLNDVIVGVV